MKKSLAMLLLCLSPLGAQAQAGYSATILSYSTANSATDVFVIVGSASKTVTVTEMCMSGTQTTLAAVAIQLVKRSTDNSGGTSTTLTAVPDDSADPAATAVVRAYTANPAGLGALVGVVRAAREIVPGTASGVVGNALCYKFSSHNAIVLHGTSEVLAFNFNGVTVTGDTFAASVSWTEE